MEFLNKLEEDSLNKKPRHDDSYRGFKGLNFNDITLSVQASYGHYCSPRKTLRDLTDYSRMEIALLKNAEFIRVKDVLPQFSQLDEIEKYYDTVYGYVPVELIDLLYKELNQKFN